MGEADAYDLNALARVRLEQESRILKKTLKDYYALFAQGLSEDKLITAHEVFTSSLVQLTFHLSKSSRIGSVAAVELASYSAQIAKAEQETEAVTAELEALAEQLKSAEVDRAHKIEYDEKEKLLAAVPTKEHAQAAIDKLNEDLADLTSEQATYAARWQSRQISFASIVDDLQSMCLAIREEKEQQERKALAAAEDDEELPGASAMSKSASQIPGDSEGRATPVPALSAIPPSATTAVAEREEGEMDIS